MCYTDWIRKVDCTARAFSILTFEVVVCRLLIIAVADCLVYAAHLQYSWNSLGVGT